MHSNKRFAFGVLDNEDSSRDAITNKASSTAFISRRLGEDNGPEVDDDDDRQALIPRKGDGRLTGNDARRLSRDELNEVSTNVHL